MNISTEVLLARTLENINTHLEAQTATQGWILQALREIQQMLPVVKEEHGKRTR